VNFSEISVCMWDFPMRSFMYVFVGGRAVRGHVPSAYGALSAALCVKEFLETSLTYVPGLFPLPLTTNNTRNVPKAFMFSDNGRRPAIC
jgi:hypothetical protein